MGSGVRLFAGIAGLMSNIESSIPWLPNVSLLIHVHSPNRETQARTGNPMHRLNALKTRKTASFHGFSSIVRQLLVQRLLNPSSETAGGLVCSGGTEPCTVAFRSIRSVYGTGAY
jgi:hypothetical protein